MAAGVPAACYQCLGALDTASTAKDLAACKSDNAAHTQYFHRSCQEEAATCLLCQQSQQQPALFLCNNAARKLPAIQKEGTPDSAATAGGASAFVAFFAEIVRLCALPNALSIAPSLYEGGVCELLYLLNSRCTHDPATAAAGLRALAAVANSGYRDAQHRLASTEGPYRLCRSIECHSGNLEVTCAGLDAITATVTNDSKTLGLFEEALVLQAIINSIKSTYLKEVALWLPTLRALRVLMKHNMDKSNEHCMAACDLIVNMLKTCCSSEQGPGDSPELAKEIKRYLCQVLGDLSVDEGSIQIMLDKKTCKYLLLLMTKGRGDADVQVAACRAVANMCMHNASARAFFAEFLPTLLRRMLDSHKSSPVVIQAALQTATALCPRDGSSKKNAETLGAANVGLCKVMVDTLKKGKRGSDSEAVETAAIRAIGALAYASPEIADRLRELEAFQALTETRSRHVARGQEGQALVEELDIVARAFDASRPRLSNVSPPPVLSSVSQPPVTVELQPDLANSQSIQEKPLIRTRSSTQIRTDRQAGADASLVGTRAIVNELSSTQQLPRVHLSRMSQSAGPGLVTSQSVKHIRAAALKVKTAVKIRNILGGAVVARENQEAAANANRPMSQAGRMATVPRTSDASRAQRGSVSPVNRLSGLSTASPADGGNSAPPTDRSSRPSVAMGAGNMSARPSGVQPASGGGGGEAPRLVRQSTVQASGAGGQSGMPSSSEPSNPLPQLGRPSTSQVNAGGAEAALSPQRLVRQSTVQGNGGGGQYGGMTSGNAGGSAPSSPVPR